MSLHFVSVFTTGVCVATVLTLGCEQSMPAPPTAPPPPGAPSAPTPADPRLWTISPNTGTIEGRTPVLIAGEGFEPGAVVTFGGRATEATVTDRTTVSALTPPHGAAVVDVVVTNPGGRSARLTSGYTYAVITGGPAPSIAAVSPDAGTIWGGGQLRIIGANFLPGAIVRLGDIQLRTFATGSSSAALEALPPPRAPGRVDVTVINPDGQSATAGSGYRYAEPGTLDFSGQWKGIGDDFRDGHSSTELALTIENKAVISVSCNSATTMLSPPAVIINDEFSFAADNGVVVSGTFQSANSVTGKIAWHPCGPSWGASKQR
jgi:hypothetical protein